MARGQIEEPAQQTLRKPQNSDQVLWDILLGISGYPAVVVAHQMKFFKLLAKGPLSINEICAQLQIEHRPARAIVAICASLGFVRLVNGRYSLTSFGPGIPASRQSDILRICL